MQGCLPKQAKNRPAILLRLLRSGNRWDGDAGHSRSSKGETMNTTRVFIHRLESTGRGTKGSYFRERYPDMIIEDYFGNFQERMETLEALLALKSGLILVGSSYGGLMAATYACLHTERVDKLILLAPALHLPEFDPCLGKKLPMPVTIFHGNKDEVVPLSAVREIAEGVFTHLTFTVVEDDHSLHDTFAALDWDALLSI